MSLGIKIEIEDNVSAAQRNLTSVGARRRVTARGAGAVSSQIQRHLIAKGPNKQFPGSSTGFYAAAARAVTVESDERGATISIQKLGISQRYHGGTIRHVNVENLTLPVVAQAYGKSAREFSGLTVMIRRVDGQPKAIGLADSEGTLMFRFAKSVTQAPDKTVLPDDADMGRTATRAMSRQIEREWNTPQQGGQT